MKKVCPRCLVDKELDESNFYLARPRKNHPKGGWQSYCKLCWVSINAEQRVKRVVKTPVGARYNEIEDIPSGGTLYEIVGTDLIEKKRELVN